MALVPLKAPQHVPECAPPQAESEERAREAVAAGTARKVKELEARCEALGETVVELREALDRQRQAADLREEMLKQVRVVQCSGCMGLPGVGADGSSGCKGMGTLVGSMLHTRVPLPGIEPAHHPSRSPLGPTRTCLTWSAAARPRS